MIDIVPSECSSRAMVGVVGLVAMHLMTTSGRVTVVGGAGGTMTPATAGSRAITAAMIATTDTRATVAAMLLTAGALVQRWTTRDLTEDIGTLIALVVPVRHG